MPAAGTLKEPARVLMGLSQPAGAGGVATYQGAARCLAHLTPQQLFAPCGVGAFCLTCGFRLLSLH